MRGRARPRAADASLKETKTKMRCPSPSSCSSRARASEVPKSGNDAAAKDPAAAVLTNVRRSICLPNFRHLRKPLKTLGRVSASDVQTTSLATKPGPHPTSATPPHSDSSPSYRTPGELVFRSPGNHVEYRAVRVLAECWLRRMEEVHKASRSIDSLINRRRATGEAAADEQGSVEPIGVPYAQDGQPGTRIGRVSDMVDQEWRKAARGSVPAHELGHLICAA